MTRETQTRRRFLQAGGAAAVTVATAGLATTTASAQSSSQGILADGVGDGGDTQAFLWGRVTGMTVGPPSEDAEALADQIRNEFNANSEHWINYGNWLIDEVGVTALGDTTVAVDVQVSKWIGDDETVPTTIDVGYNADTDEFTSLEWRLEAAEDPDYQTTIMDKAAENGQDELAEFRREFIDTSGDGNHEVPSSEYVSRHVGKYSSFIEIGDDGQSVLELLLGEVDV